MVQNDKASQYGWRFITEPIVNINRKVVAVEVLTRFATPGSPLLHLSNMTMALKKELLIAQLMQIVHKRIFFEKNNLLCSINIDADMASILIQDPEISGLFLHAHS